jgi:hypothetical protein
MRLAILCVTCLELLAASARAQSTYVAGGVGADLFRSDRVDVRGFDDPTASGEAVALSARIGTAVSDRWGVELEVTRAGEIEHEWRPGGPLPLAARQVPSVRLFQTAIRIFESTIRVSRRHTTLDAVAWVAQTLTARVDLVYLGGVAFARTVEDMTFEVARRPGISAPIVVPNATRTTSYGAGPVAGLEARVQLTSRIVLMPGVCLHAIGGDTGGGWLARPAVALGWRF